MLPGIKGKRVLVTGASGGIGSASAELFAASGASVGIHYRSRRAAAERLRARIRALGGQAELFRADLRSPAQCSGLIAAFARRMGGLDVLVNNAGGVAGYGDFSRLAVKDWDETFALDARAPFLLSRAAFPHLKAAGGRIINVSSVSAKYGGSRQTLHYGAAKAALEALTRGLAKAWAPFGVRVNAVRPGFILTPVHAALKRSGIKARIAKIPLGRAGLPADVARMILYLASDGGDFVTGEVVSVSGGD